MLSSNIEYRGKIWGFWGTLLWGIVIAFLLVIGQLLPLVGYMLFTNMEMSMASFDFFASRVESDAFLLFLSVTGSTLLVVPLVFAIAKLKKGSILKEYFDLYAFSLKTFSIWFGILILLLIFETYAIAALGAKEIPDFMLNIDLPDMTSKLLLLFAVVLMAPLVEEVIFRGFLLKGFSQTFMGTTGAIIVTSFLWAIIHFQYELVYVAVIFVVGLVFGYARVQTGTLYIPLVLHMLMNLVASLGLFYEKSLV